MPDHDEDLNFTQAEDGYELKLSDDLARTFNEVAKIAMRASAEFAEGGTSLKPLQKIQKGAFRGDADYGRRNAGAKRSHQVGPCLWTYGRAGGEPKRRAAGRLAHSHDKTTLPGPATQPTHDRRPMGPWNAI